MHSVYEMLKHAMREVLNKLYGFDFSYLKLKKKKL